MQFKQFRQFLTLVKKPKCGQVKGMHAKFTKKSKGKRLHQKLN